MKQIQLNNGTSIPGIGFGTGTALYGQECADMILSALEHGYTYLDCAQMYGNAASIGTALKRWKGKREDVYILTKMGMEKVEHTDPREALQEQLKLMGVDYVDMYLCHAPYLATPSLGENWKAMEQLVKDGLTKSIGVSNYASEDIEELSKIWTIPPAVNQIEYNPYVYHAPNMLRLREMLDKHGIKIQAYGPLNSVHRVTGGPVDPVAKRIAEAHNVTESQVLLAWASQFGGGCVVTTSRNDQRQKEQLAAIDLELTKEEVDEIAKAGKGKFERYFMHRAWDRAKP